MRLKIKLLFYLNIVRLKSTISLLIAFFYCFGALAQTKSQYKPSSNIVKWEKVEIKKDFILSNSLMYHRFCRKVWTKQISEFKVKNPHIVDVNKFEIGDIVELQLCTDFKFKPIGEELKQEMNDSFVVVDSIDNKNNLPVADNSKTASNNSLTDSPFTSDFTLLFTFGGLAEQDEKTQAALGFRVLANIKERIGYRLRLDYAPTVLMWHNELLIQTIPQNDTRYYLGYGLGNRMGLKPNADILLSDKTTGYTTVSLGTSFKAGAGYIDFQVGSNLSNHFSPFFSVMAGKKLGDTPYTLGGFIDYRSTRSSKEDTNADRHWMGAGILFSY